MKVCSLLPNGKVGRHHLNMRNDTGDVIPHFESFILSLHLHGQHAKRFAPEDLLLLLHANMWPVRICAHKKPRIAAHVQM